MKGWLSRQTRRLWWLGCAAALVGCATARPTVPPCPIPSAAAIANVTWLVDYEERRRLTGDAAAYLPLLIYLDRLETFCGAIDAIRD